MAKIDFCNEQAETGKDWRDAFLESEDGRVMEAVAYSMADAIKVEDAGVCTTLQCLMHYCSSFTNGGMWINHISGVRFVTNGTGSDPDATYEDAKKFIENFKLSKSASENLKN